MTLSSFLDSLFWDRFIESIMSTVSQWSWKTEFITGVHPESELKLLLQIKKIEGSFNNVDNKFTVLPKKLMPISTVKIFVNIVNKTIKNYPWICERVCPSLRRIISAHLVWPCAAAIWSAVPSSEGVNGFAPSSRRNFTAAGKSETN